MESKNESQTVMFNSRITKPDDFRLELLLGVKVNLL